MGGVFLLLVIMIVIAFLLGVLCGIKVSNKKIGKQNMRGLEETDCQKFSSNEETDQFSEGRVYEEIVDIKTIAYGDIMTWNSMVVNVIKTCVYYVIINRNAI